MRMHRITAPDLPVHDDELPGVGAVVVAVALLAAALIALAPAPHTDLLSMGAGLIERATRGVVVRVRAPMRALAGATSAASSTPHDSAPAPHVVTPTFAITSRFRDAVTDALDDVPHEITAHDLAPSHARPVAPAEPFICIYPGTDAATFRAALERAVRACAHERTWGSVRRHGRDVDVNIRVGDPRVGACVADALRGRLPRVDDDTEVGAPFLYEPSAT